jgi:hypothetical protein
MYVSSPTACCPKPKPSDWASEANCAIRAVFYIIDQIGTSVLGLGGKAAAANEDINIILNTTHTLTKDIVVIIDKCDDNKTVETMQEMWTFLEKLENTTVQLNQTIYGMAAMGTTRHLARRAWTVLHCRRGCGAEEAGQRAAHCFGHCRGLPVPCRLCRHGNRRGAGNHERRREQNHSRVCSCDPNSLQTCIAGFGLAWFRLGRELRLQDTRLQCFSDSMAA